MLQPGLVAHAVGRAAGQTRSHADKSLTEELDCVTSIKPLLVTVLDSAEARGYQWDEVRQIPEDAHLVERDESDYGCMTPEDTLSKPRISLHVSLRAVAMESA